MNPDSRPPDSDAQAREAALDPSRSFLIEAPAGSGKTGLLVQRFLKLLATVDRPERILAITFTRKAAAEMRARILAALATADPPPSSDPYAQTTHGLAAAARGQAEAQGWDLSALASRLRIQTIDAFCAWLARRAPWRAGAAASARILDDLEAQALYREAAERALAAAPQTPALLARYAGNAARLVNELAALLARRERLRGALDADLGAAAEEALRADLQEELPVLAERLKPLESELLQAIAFAKQHLPRDHSLQAWSGWPAANPGHLPAWKSLADFCLTKDGEPRRKLDRRDGFPPKGEHPKAEEAKKAALAAFARLDAAAVAALHRLRRLPGLPLSESLKQGFVALQALIRHALAELELLFAERGATDFTGMALAALEALGSEEDPTDLLLSLDQAIHHILVDEFQDTSALQLELLKRLTAGWQEGDGRSLFLVGDPMQSIYRFREANVGLFLAVREQAQIGKVALETLRLTRNFRSRPELVAEANARFARLLPLQDRHQEGRAAMREAQATREGGGGIDYCIFRDVEEERTAALQAIADWIASRAAEGQVAVLVRSREHALPLLGALKRRGIAVHAPDFDRLSERPLVADLATLALALSHPADRTAWLGVLRAPWCGLDQADLSALCRDLGPGDALWPRLRALAERAAPAEDGGELSEAGRQRIAALVERLRPFVERGASEPLRERLEAAWLALGGPAAAREAAELGDVDRFFAWLERRGEEPAIADHEGFLEALAELRAAALAPPEAPVVLLTIHQAKGLEFPHVALIGLGAAVRRSEKPMLLGSEVIAGEGALPLLALRPAPKEDPGLYDFAWEMLEKPREEAERERLLYVAMTRARETLLLACELQAEGQGSELRWEPAKGSLGEVLWRSFAAGERPALPPASTAGPEASTGAVPPSPPMPAPSPLRRIALPTPEAQPLAAGSESAVRPGRPHFDWAGEPARLAGILFHRFAEQIAGNPQGLGGTLSEAARRLCVAELSAAGLSRQEMADAIARIEQALAAVQADPKARWLFAAHGGSAKSELELLSREDDGRIRRHRIDRSFIDEQGVRWIIDFKLGRHEGGALEAFIAEEKARYREQLIRYAGLFAHEGRPIRLALYYPLLPEGARWLEIEAEAPAPASEDRAPPG